ncbi:hypothetical protein L3X38_008792 [Prunus dulcis]|uniref:Uncharacterized protein n=1 Tax=Prunus dulcis TaxID=3755 RepID=A0AAD4ZX42_PRUDU|nr:hypothetical protein L3X38_008792 [Prunus dulcis]
MKKASKTETLEPQMGSLPMCLGRTRFIKEDEVGENNEKRKGSMTELEPLEAIKGGLLLPRRTNPFPELDQALSSSWKIYSKPPHLLLHSFSSSIRKETSQIFLCLL